MKGYVLLLTIVCVVLFACRKDENIVEINGIASGSNVTPTAVTTTGTAAIEGVYNKISRMFSYKVSWDNLRDTVTRINFRGPADAGGNGPIVIEVSIPFKRDSGSVAGFAVLRDTIGAQLTSGNLYMLVQSKAFGNGELRGQLKPK